MDGRPDANRCDARDGLPLRCENCDSLCKAAADFAIIDDLFCDIFRVSKVGIATDDEDGDRNDSDGICKVADSTEYKLHVQLPLLQLDGSDLVIGTSNLVIWTSSLNFTLLGNRGSEISLVVDLIWRGGTFCKEF